MHCQRYAPTMKASCDAKYTHLKEVEKPKLHHVVAGIKYLLVCCSTTSWSSMLDSQPLAVLLLWVRLL